MKANTLFLGVLLSLLFSSCSNLSYFTQSLYDNAGWQESELKRIQFYLSDDVVLRRQLKGAMSTISSGEIKIIDGRQVEEVVIPKGTPGVLLFLPKEKRFAVSFDASSKDSYLVFGPNPKRKGRYVLLASDWEGRSGTITYEGKKWRTEGSSTYASLMVDLKKINRVSVDSKRAKGRRVE